LTRLFHFRYGDITASETDATTNNNQETFIVKVTVGTSSGNNETAATSMGANDLVSQLSSQLSQSNQKVIFEPSQVVAFQLTSAPQVLPSYSSSTNTGTGAGGGGRKKFKYPKSIYLDQFLRENADLANEKRRLGREMNEEVQRLALKKQGLMYFKVTFSIYFFEDKAVLM
jgi:hypothetical protein